MEEAEIYNPRGYVICNENGSQYETSIPVNIAPIEKNLERKID